MSFWLLVLSSFPSIWLGPAYAGSAFSKLKSTNEGDALRLRTASLAETPLYPSGLLSRGISEMFAAQQNTPEFRTQHGLSLAHMLMAQPRQDGLPRDDDKFVLRLFQAPMTITMTAPHTRIINGLVESCELVQKTRYSNWHFSTPHFHHEPDSEPGTNKRPKPTFYPSDLVGFDLNEVLDAMRKNWGQRIHFPQGYRRYIHASVKRFPDDHPFRAFRNKLVWQVNFALRNVYVAPDDGPDFVHIHVLSNTAGQPQIATVIKPPVWLHRMEGRSEIVQS